MKNPYTLDIGKNREEGFGKLRADVNFLYQAHKERESEKYIRVKVARAQLKTALKLLKANNIQYKL